MSHAAHFSVSLEPDLLNEFDRFCGDRQCPNWSEAVRQPLREKLRTAPWTSDTSHAVATLTLVYGHRGAKLTERLLKVQHERLDVVVSTTHIHLDHATCLEVIILQGRVNELQIIASRLCGLKGSIRAALVVATFGGQGPRRATAYSGADASNGET